MSHLPLEIWALIVEHLADDDWATLDALAACSLLETRLVPLARKYLFGGIGFHMRNPRDVDDRYKQLELRFPVIAPYVRRLQVFGYGENRRAGSNEFAHYVSLLAAAVGSRVDTLFLSHTYMPHKHEDSAMPFLMQGFPQLRHLNFECVTFRSVDLMADYLASCPLLESLRLEACSFETMDLEKECSLPPVQELELIDINGHGDMDQVLSWATQSGLTSSLRRLDVWSVKESEYQAFAAFVSSPALRLSALVISLGFRGQSSGTFI
jgi:hypothetical protein